MFMKLAKKKKNNSKHQKKIKEGRKAYGYQIMNELSNATRKKKLSLHRSTIITVQMIIL